MADWIWMQFRVVGRLGPRMRQAMGRSNFKGEFGASHYNQCGLCCIVV